MFTKFGSVLALLWLWSLAAEIPAAVINVPADYSTIQAAIDAANDGDEIIVAEGSYLRIRFKGKNLNIHSTDPSDEEVVRNTRIRPGGGGTVVIFDGTENETCRLAGFEISGGLGRFYIGEPPHNGSGIRGNGCKATIEHNYIFANLSLNPSITFSKESERWEGGGINDCDGLIQNNIIDRNFANQGAGLFGCDGIIQNNIITRNIALPIADGTGDYKQSIGGALDECAAIIRNNTIINNILSGSNPLTSGGLHNCNGSVINNIIWTTAKDFPLLEYDNSTSPTYCIIKGWNKGGEGNSNLDPLLKNIKYQGTASLTALIKQDYRLHPNSPAIDAGKSTNTLSVDIEGKTRGFDWKLKSGGDGSNWDIGAYEFTTTSLNLWIPDRPLEIQDGSQFKVKWLAYAGVGDTVQLALHQDTTFIASLGQSTTPVPGEIYETAVQLPDNLPQESGYTIVGTSTLDGQITSESHPFTIIPPKNNAGGHWVLFE